MIAFAPSSLISRGIPRTAANTRTARDAAATAMRPEPRLRVRWMGLMEASLHDQSGASVIAQEIPTGSFLREQFGGHL
jgi:hypothetical protein